MLSLLVCSWHYNIKFCLLSLIIGPDDSAFSYLGPSNQFFTYSQVSNCLFKSYCGSIFYVDIYRVIYGLSPCPIVTYLTKEKSQFSHIFILISQVGRKGRGRGSNSRASLLPLNCFILCWVFLLIHCLCAIPFYLNDFGYFMKP